MTRGGGVSVAGVRALTRSPPRRPGAAPGGSSSISNGRSAGSATATPPSSPGSQSQRVRVMAASPRPSATTSAQRARSRPCPSPSPVHRWLATRSRSCAPGQSPATSSTPRPRRSVASRRLPDLRRSPRGRPQQDELAAVEQRRHHLRPGRARIGDQQGPPGVQAEGRGRQHPGLGYPGDPAPRPVRRRGGRERQAEQAELRHGHHRPARQPASRQQPAQRGQHRQHRPCPGPLR